MLRIGSMKTTPLRVLIAAAGLALAACSSTQTAGIRVGDTPARRIAKDTSLPGKGVQGQCLPFAEALHRKFQAAGIPSKVITYRYDSLNAPAHARQPMSGTHAVVAYNDQGRTYIMDNQSWMPKWVGNASAVGMAQQFSGMDIHVASAQEKPTNTGRF